MEHIKCANCRYVRPDMNASEQYWTAFECGNGKSEYYRCLLNVGVKGTKLPRITWTGCKYGSERRDST